MADQPLNPKLYLVERYDDNTGCDQMASAVVAADSDYDARLFAARAHRDEDPVVWFEPTTTVLHIGYALEVIATGVVLADINEG